MKNGLIGVPNKVSGVVFWLMLSKKGSLSAFD